MKSLKNYISEKLIICPQRYDNVDEKLVINQQVDEKLIINKNFKNYDYNVPNEHGRCVVLAYPCSKTGKQVKRIDVGAVDYDYDSDSDKVSIYYSKFDKKSKEGIYYGEYPNWIYFAFFNDDALNILNDIMDNPERPFNLSELIPSLKNKIKENLVPMDMHYPDPLPYTQEQIQDMIDFLNNENIK